jgi:hypothetical protein
MTAVARAPAGAGTRLRVRRLLDAAALEPPGLSPAAVLVVRSLADPLPGRVAPRPGDVRAPPEWERAVRAALAERWRGAARPARGPVPAGAEAVYFADAAEMIAAFARDAVAGEAARWWWRALLKGLPGGPVEALAALWAREARYVPAALEHLAATRDAARVVAALPAPQATRILAALAAAFEAPALLAAPRPGADRASDDTASTRDALPAREASPSADLSAETPAGITRRTPSPALPPWTGFLPPDAVPRGLATEHAALLGLALMLHRAPLAARGSAFVARFVRWRAEAAAPPAPPPSRAAEIVDRPASPEDSVDGVRREAEDPDRPRRPSTAWGDDSARTPSTDRDQEDPARDRVPAQSADAGQSADLHRPTAVAPARTAEDVGDGNERTGDEADAPSAIARRQAEEARAASAACGVFFLVNVLRSLGFYRALDEHFALEPAVGGWGWLELTARALLGPAAGGVADDPLWRVLAELDGRAPTELPGTGFVPPAVETLPAAWIDLFRGAPPPPAPHPPLGMRAGPGLRRFLDLVVPVVRARTEAALRAAGADPEERLETVLLRRTGTVEATRSHVDVWMELDQATLPVRIAGLDANPGWVPELARVVTFHFG